MFSNVKNAFLTYLDAFKKPEDPVLRISADVRNKVSAGVRDSAALGLVDLGSDNGGFVQAVGYHPDLPNIAIKVVYLDDAWLLYARAIKDGALTGTLYPVIHEINELDDTAVVLMERFNVSYYDGLNLNGFTLPTGVISLGFFHEMAPLELCEFVREHDLLWDLHGGNAMWRENGELVLIDPVWWGE